jgi:signal transduction histidine kinase
VERLLKDVQNFSRESLVKTGRWEAQAQHGLFLSLWVTVVGGFLLAWWIVGSIVRPLRRLNEAAVAIGQGHFQVRLSTGSGDELAKLAEAFNTMSGQLEEFKSRLEKQNHDLKTVNAELDRFIHIMGHDIANPLTVMIASCAYLEQHAGQAMDPKSLEALQGIRKASTKMHQMVKEMLEFTRSKRPKMIDVS